jgi:threonine dehydratase
MTAPPTALPTFADLESAADRIAGVAHRTPVATSRTLDERTGATVFCKCENLQRIGAFKFRGAYNAVSRLTDAQKKAGVLAFSSGNHAQAIALACRLLGAPAVIVMPHDAPQVKVNATKGYGAEVILYERSETSREQLGAKLAAERGLTIIPPFDHPHVIAGQGTAGKELFEEVGELDMLLVCVGGGGLISGCAIAASELSPTCRVIGVEPEAGDDGVRSFREKKIVAIKTPDTIADGARTDRVGDLTLACMLRHVHDMTTVPDAALVRTMRFVWERMKLVIEPTGALALAALLEGKVEAKGKRVGVIFSGGNVDLSRACELFGSVRE